MCTHNANTKFAELGVPGRIWAIPAIHGNLSPLTRIHDVIYDAFHPGDQLLYLGNYTGYGSDNVEVIDELLTFRRLILSIPGVFPSDMVYLRGRQEEMMAKLLQLQFAPDAPGVLDWMLSNGLEPTMRSYGVDIDRGRRAAMEGVTGLGFWTKQIRDTLNRHAGHETFRNHLKRAAYTDMTTSHPLLFVHAGLEPSKALSVQGDNFWWASDDFHTIDKPYSPFQRVIRGYDPAHNGIYVNGVTATLDNGCGFGGDLVFARIDTHDGSFDILSA